MSFFLYSYWEKNSWDQLPLASVFKGNPLEGDIFVAMMEMNSDLQVIDLFLCVACLSESDK